MRVLGLSFLNILNMGETMPDRARNVMLPFSCPTQKRLREAKAAIQDMTAYVNSIESLRVAA